MRPKIFFLVAASLLLAGCRFEAPAPALTPAPPTPQPPLSTLAATLTIPARQLATLLDNTTEYRIADLSDQPAKCGIGRCRIDLTADRTGPVSVTAEQDMLGFTIPFAVKARLAGSGNLSFLRVQGEGQGIAKGQTSLALSPDLQLRTSTTGTVDLTDGHVHLGPLVVDISQIWNSNQQHLTQPLWHALDRQTAKLPLRARLAQLWASAFVPLRVGKSPRTWLVLRPEQFRVAQPRIRDGAVTLSVSLAARGQILVQDLAPANPATVLPAAEAMAAPSDSFDLAIPVLLPYGRAADIAMAALKKRPPRIAGMTVRFDQLRIMPSGQDIVVMTKLCADPGWDWFGWFASCGTVYLRGAPVFDPEHRTIRVDGLHYDIASANLMLKAMRALAGDALAENLQPHLVFDEAREIDRLESRLTTELATPQGHDLALSAQLQSFGAPAFTWTGDGFLALFSARGTVHADLRLGEP